MQHAKATHAWRHIVTTAGNLRRHLTVKWSLTPRPKDGGVHTLIQRLPCPPADAGKGKETPGQTKRARSRQRACFADEEEVGGGGGLDAEDVEGTAVGDAELFAKGVAGQGDVTGRD